MDNPVPRLAIDNALFAQMPEDVKALQKQARKELRNKTRRAWLLRQQAVQVSREDETRK